MAGPFIIECICGTSFSVDRAKALRSPSATIKCKGITKQRIPCGEIYTMTEIIERMERSDVWIVDAATRNARTNPITSRT